MNSRSRLLVASFVFVLLAVLVLGGPAIAAAGPKKGSGGWYWPVGTENFHGWDGYWKYRASNHSWHMAQDMPVPQGSPVYAIADGVIAESKADAGYGGVLVLWHYTGNGQKFLAVYGHIIRVSGMNKGVKVKAGQVIGHVNSANHCHFGIHPGTAYPPDGNPFRGHTYIGSQTYGWVDPVKFLKNNPAYLTYTAPPLPFALSVSTVSTPTVLGIDNGSVYWTVTSSSSTPTVYVHVMPHGATTKLDDDAVLPPLDATRYLAKPSATAFTLWDRLPVISATFSASQPAWATPITVTGTLRNTGGKPFLGAKVVLERSTNGTSWTAAATAMTSLNGAYSISYVVPRTYRLRVAFKPPATYLSATSVVATVSPKPGLHAPDSITQDKTGRVMTVSGKIDTRHPAGANTVTLRIQQHVASAWVDRVATSTVNANSGAGTRYSQRVTLAAGTFRVRASCQADSLYAADRTAWVGFKVK